MLLPRNAPAWLDRLVQWLEPFEREFGHVAQRGAFRRYVLGLLNDSRRKSMSGMLERVSDPGTYQAFQHFITDAPWRDERVWRRLRRVMPERAGVLILDATSFPKQGTHSVGVARQYCGTLGKVANCQVAVTAALWTGVRAWMLGAALYLPETWLSSESPSARAHSPDRSLSRKVALGAHASEADPCGRVSRNSGPRRCRLRRQRDVAPDPAPVAAAVHPRDLVDPHGLSRHTARGVPARKPGRAGTPTRLQLTDGRKPEAVAAIGAGLPAQAWRRISWRNGTNRLWAAHFAALRVTPAHDWRPRRLAPEISLLFERDLGATPRIKAYLVALPPTASRRALVRLAHQRWAIEQQYQELKDELGLDHFEGRSWPGWQRHVVLTALAYAWLQHERCRRGARLPTLPVARAVITEILTAHFFVTHPHYLKTMLKLAEINLRI